MARKQNWWSSAKFLLFLNTLILAGLFLGTAPSNDWLIIGFILLICTELSLLFGLLPLGGKLTFVLRVLLPLFFGSYLFYLWVSNF